MPTPQQDSANLAKSIIDHATDAIIFVDTEGWVRIWNAGAERIFGYCAQDILGGQLDPIIPAHLVTAHNNGFKRAIATGQMRYEKQVLTTRAQHKNGERLYVDMSFDLVRDAKGNILGVVAFARDVTQRQAKDAATRAKITELEKALAEKTAP